MRISKVIPEPTLKSRCSPATGEIPYDNVLFVDVRGLDWTLTVGLLPVAPDKRTMNDSYLTISHPVGANLELFGSFLNVELVTREFPPPSSMTAVTVKYSKPKSECFVKCSVRTAFSP